MATGRTLGHGPYEDARRDLAEDLERMAAQGLDMATPFTAQHLRVTLAQVEAGVKRLERRLGTVLSASVDKTRTQSLQDLLRVVASQEREFKGAGGRIEHEVLRRFTADQGLLLHQHSIERYGRDVVNRIQRELVVGVTRGQTWRQIAKRLTDAENSVLAGMRSRGELIVRMELNGAYNDAHLTSIREAGRVLDEAHPGDPLLKKADEFFDLRNHALSRVLDGQVQPADQPFKVSVARVQAEHEALQAERVRRKLPPRRLTGILWEQVGGDYVGMNYPAHFWERGRIVPWRKSWGEETGAARFSLSEGEDAPAAVERADDARGTSTTARRMRKEGQLTYGTKTLTPRYGEVRKSIEEGVGKAPEDILRQALDGGWLVDAVSEFSDLPRSKRLLSLGRTDELHGRTTISMEALRHHRGTAYTGSKTILHELAHVCDSIPLRHARRSRLHETREFMAWHSVAIEDGSLRDLLNGFGVKPDRYVDPGPMGQRETWAELLAHAWDSTGRRRAIDGRWPGLIDSMEEAIRHEQKGAEAR